MLAYVDIVRNRVNKTVTEKFNLQAFRARIRLFRLAWETAISIRFKLKVVLHVCIIYSNCVFV
jgi:hypothetical protein